MGCECVKKEADQKEITKKPEEKNEEDKNNNNIIATAKSEKLPSESSEGGTGKINYDKAIIDYINQVRIDPPSFIPKIEEAISKITNSKDKLIYGGKVKVALKEGKPAFLKAIDLLKEMKPMKPLEFSNEIEVEVPEDVELMKDAKYLQAKVNGLKGSVQIDGNIRELVKDPYTSVLLMVIDDTGTKSGTKRNIILGKEFKKMAVTHRRIDKTFCAFLTFAK